MRNRAPEWPSHWPEPHDPDTPDDATVPALEGARYLLDTFPDMVDEFDRWRDYRRTADYRIEYVAYAVRYSVSGDYVGSYVERSNCVVLCEDIAPTILREAFALYSGTAAVFDMPVDGSDPFPDGVDAWPLSELYELAEALCALEGYPVLSEDTWSGLEMEARDAAWLEFWDDGLPRALERIADDIDDDDIDDGRPYPWMPSRPAGHILNVPAVVEYGTDVWAGSDSLYDIPVVEGLSVWIDADACAEGILMGFVDDGGDPWTLAPWADPTAPEFDSARSHASRVAAHNRAVAEIRTAALRCGSTWDVG